MSSLATMSPLVPDQPNPYPQLTGGGQFLLVHDASDGLPMEEDVHMFLVESLQFHPDFVKIIHTQGGILSFEDLIRVSQSPYDEFVLCFNPVNIGQYPYMFAFICFWTLDK